MSHIEIESRKWGWSLLRVERLSLIRNRRPNDYWGIRVLGVKILIWHWCFDRKPAPIATVQFGEGPSWSPDGGAFWRKAGKIYWADGDITEDRGMMREMPYDIPRSEWHNHENYSEWSDEKRAEVVARVKAEREAMQKEDDEQAAAMKALCISAKAKLTKEEYDAVQWSQYSYQNPWYSWDDLP